MARAGDFEIWTIPEFERTVGHDLSRFRQTTAAEDFRASYWSQQVGQVQLIRMVQREEMQVEILEDLNYYDVILVRAGTSAVEIPRSGVVSAGRGKGVVLSPQMRARMKLSPGYEQIHLRIDPTVMQDHAEKMLGRALSAPVRFAETGLEVGSAALSWWRQMIESLAADPAGARHVASIPLAAQGVQDSILAGLLAAHPSTLTGPLERPSTYLPLRALRMADEFIEERIATPITALDIARAVGVSLRTLQRAFAEHLNTTPTQYVVTMRLEFARRDLQSAGPGETVTAVAFRWGFTHTARFAALYRSRYGELPLQTLRK